MIIKPAVRKIIVQNLNWIVLAAFFFILGLVTAVFSFKNGIFINNITDTQYEMLKKIAEMVFEGPAWKGIAILFFNNFFASLQMMLLGVLLSMPPLLGLFANGALLGSLLVELGREGVPLLSFWIAGIMPHGIFELPAFIISAAFGLKAGYHLLFPLPQKKRRESLGIVWKEFFALLPLVISLLVLAAIIEVLLTPLLVQQFLNI
ncbi:MAG: stage II sporulation protein M [Firmicutes bacterium]|nr:stage II sporulation protein M [Bacillota bacterium]